MKTFVFLGTHGIAFAGCTTDIRITVSSNSREEAEKVALGYVYEESLSDSENMEEHWVDWEELDSFEDYDAREESYIEQREHILCYGVRDWEDAYWCQVTYGISVSYLNCITPRWWNWNTRWI